MKKFNQLVARYTQNEATLNVEQKYNFKPDYVTHPGVTLAETLEALGMSIKDLSIATKQPIELIDDIIAGIASIDANMARQLESATGIPASFWNNNQKNYDAFAN